MVKVTLAILFQGFITLIVGLAFLIYSVPTTQQEANEMIGQAVLDDLEENTDNQDVKEVLEPVNESLRLWGLWMTVISAIELIAAFFNLLTRFIPF